MQSWLDEYKVTVPEGKSGPWRVERFEIDNQGAIKFNMHLMMNDCGHRRVLPGKYTKLQHKKDYNPIMSDTHAEVGDHLGFIRKATGSVLITGLGLGVVLQACMRKPEVKDVTVIEKDKDVIKLVANHYYKMFGKERLKIIHCDAFEFKPEKGKVWDAVWHDIWLNISTDNCEGVAKLNRKFGRHAEYQDYWAKPEIRRLRREERKSAELNKWLWNPIGGQISQTEFEPTPEKAKQLEGIKL